MTVKFAGSRVNETVRSAKDAKMATEDMKPQKKIEKVWVWRQNFTIKDRYSYNPYTFAGKGGSKPIRKEAQLIIKYGGKKGQWSHARGRGQVHHDDKDTLVLRAICWLCRAKSETLVRFKEA